MHHKLLYLIVYFCILLYTAYPDSNLVPMQLMYFSNESERIQLDCGIQPGCMLQQYRAFWEKSGQPINLKLSRYSLNQTTLSLIIEDLQLNDTDDQYH